MVGASGVTGAVGIVVGQSTEPSAYAALGPEVRAGITFVLTLLVGAMVVNALPNRTSRAADLAVSGPVRTVVFGLACLLFTAGAVLVLIGIPLFGLVAALLLLVFVPVTSAFGATVVGRFLGGQTTTQCLLVGAAVAAGLAVVPVGGGVAQLLVNAIGAGALLREVREPTPGRGAAAGGAGADA